MERFRLPMEPREATPSLQGGGKLHEKSLADSGYNTSELSAISEAHNSHFRGSSIEEDVEIDENAEPPTPTTRNLSKFSALQLTTPKSTSELRSPLKRSTTNDGSTTPKKMRYSDENAGYETPKKAPFGRKKSFRDRIKSDADIKTSQLPLSPITSNISKSASKILGENQFENLSSTPIKHGFRPDFYVETVENVCWNPLLPKSRSPRMKRKLLRKIQSFSPRKWQLGQNYTRRLEQCPSPIAIDEDTPPAENPAQEIISFNTRQFNNLLTVPSTKHSSSNEVKTKNAPCAAPAAGLENFSISRHVLETVEEEEKDGMNLIPLEEISSQSIREYFHEMRSMTEEASGYSAAPRVSLSSSSLRHKDSLELLHFASDDGEEEKQKEKKEKEEGLQEEMMDISLTPKHIVTLDDSVVEEEVRKGVKRTVGTFEYSPSVLHTPKKVRRCTSFQYSSDEEKHRLLYPNLPCTPPKKRARKSLDYSTKSSPRSSVKTKNAPCAAPAAGLENFSISRHVLETVEEEEKDGMNLIPLEEISSQSIREYFHEMRSMTEEASGYSAAPR
uniref:Uncharacterized protein n=2 Tax=Lutzomyia longipalpis TaxID=7200 RepID=A0A1B0CEF6_LUTLO